MNAAIDIGAIAPGVHEGEDGVYRAAVVSDVSYPADAHLELARVEDDSFWFEHRSQCLLAAMRRFPMDGPMLDVGGGRGYVTRSLQRAGLDAVLLEPDAAAVTVACERGITPVVCATLADAQVQDGSIHAAGAFDVVEHIEDDVAFVMDIARALRPGGRFYVTVPAHPILWSTEDEYAGHYRRYTNATLAALFAQTGFEVEYMTQIFGFLVPPVFALRSIPSRLGLYKRRTAADHKPSGMTRAFNPFMARELARVGRGEQGGFGTTLLAVAKKS